MPGIFCHMLFLHLEVQLGSLGCSVTVKCCDPGPGERWAGAEADTREFTGWITGRPEDYIMSLQSWQHRQKQKKSQQQSQPSLDLFSPGISNNYETLLQAKSQVANLTYQKGKVTSLDRPNMTVVEQVPTRGCPARCWECTYCWRTTLSPGKLGRGLQPIKPKQ